MAASSMTRRTRDLIERHVKTLADAEAALENGAELVAHREIVNRVEADLVEEAARELATLFSHLQGAGPRITYATKEPGWFKSTQYSYAASEIVWAGEPYGEKTPYLAVDERGNLYFGTRESFCLRQLKIRRLPLRQAAEEHGARLYFDAVDLGYGDRPARPWRAATTERLGIRTPDLYDAITRTIAAVRRSIEIEAADIEERRATALGR